MSVLRTQNEPNIMWYWSHAKEKNYEPLPHILFIADETSGLHEEPDYGMILERVRARKEMTDFHAIHQFF